MSTLDTPDQCALIAASQNGDERAFRQLVGPYRRALEVHAYRMLGSVEDAEDVVQETMLRAWNGLESFERRASVKTWLYRIATNACLDEIERRPRRPEPVDPFPDARLEVGAEPTHDPAARYAVHEGLELALLAAIQHLPGRQRATLILRDVLGWSAAEVAALLDTTVAATNSALQRARATIDERVPEPTRRPATKTPARDLLDRYLALWERTDVDGLVALLKEDAVMRMPPRPDVEGATAIGDFFRALPGSSDRSIADVAVRGSWANGRPALVMHWKASGAPHGVLVLETEDDRVANIDAYIGEAHVRRFHG